MTSPKAESKTDLYRLLARSRRILRVLYPNHEMSIYDIAKKTNDYSSNISKKIETLQQEHIVLTRDEKEKGKGGRPKKICSLSWKGRNIVDLLEKTSHPKLTQDQIGMLISLMNDTALSANIRSVAANTLSEDALTNSDTVLKNPEIKKMLEQAVSNYSNIEEKILKSTLSILSATLPYITQNKQTTEWFQDNIYDDLMKITTDETASKPLQQWAITTASRIAQLSNNYQLTDETLRTLLNIYFKNSELSKLVEDELLKFDTKMQTKVIKKVREYAKREEKKTAAEDLLQVLIRNWWGKDLSRYNFIQNSSS
jgi:predicted transcriptional regulator